MYARACVFVCVCTCAFATVCVCVCVGGGGGLCVGVWMCPRVRMHMRLYECFVIDNRLQNKRLNKHFSFFLAAKRCLCVCKLVSV